MNKIKVLAAGLIFLLACNKKKDNNISTTPSLIPSPVDSIVGDYTGKWASHLEKGQIDTFYGAFDTAYVTTISISKIDGDTIQVDFGNSIVQKYRYYHAGMPTGNSFLSHSSDRSDTLVYHTDSLLYSIESGSHIPVKPYEYTSSYSTFKAKRK